MFLGLAAAAFGLIQHDNTIFHMLTFITLTKTLKDLQGIVRVCHDCLNLFGTFPPLSCDLQLLIDFLLLEYYSTLRLGDGGRSKESYVFAGSVHLGILKNFESLATAL